MARHWLVWLALIAGVPALVRAADEKPLEGDLKELQGDWKLLSMEERGKSEPDEMVSTCRVTFKGDEMIIKIGTGDKQEQHSVTIKLDSTKTPKAIDLTANDGPDRGKAVRGIYTFEGGKLQIAGADGPGDETTRPAEFKSTAESKVALLVMERVKDK